MTDGPEKKKPAVPSKPDQPPDGEKPVDQLTPEEQMERFAKDQKENDWGHQPC